MKNYTAEQIQDFYDYLNFAVKEGYLDVDTAEKIMRDKDWAEVKKMMSDGDDEANRNEP